MSNHLAMIYEILHPTTELALYAFPINPAYPLSTWTTNRVLMTEDSKMYYATIDLSKSYHWAVFQGATQPTSYDAALYEDTFYSATAVNITPGSSTAINRGDVSNVKLFFNENALVVIPSSIDLTALNIKFVLEDSTKTNLLNVANGSIARTSTSFSVLIPNTVTNTLQDLIWSLRTTADDKVLLRGTMSVEYASY